MGLYTSTMRFTGLSGIDVESLVTQLMKAEGQKLAPLQAKQTLTLWKQAAFQSVGDALKNFQDTFLSFASGTTTNIRSGSFFNSMAFSAKVNNVDSGAITVTANSDAKPGSHSIQVLQLATQDTYTGAAQKNRLVGDGGAFAGIDASDSFNVKLDNGTTKTIDFKDFAGDPDSLQDVADYINTKLYDIYGSNANGQVASASVVTKDGVPGIAIETQIGRAMTVYSSSNPDSTPNDGLTKLGFKSGGDTRYTMASQKLSALGMDALANDNGPVTVNGTDYGHSFTLNGVTIGFNSDETLSDLANRINSSGAGVTLSYDGVTQTVQMRSNGTGVESAIRADAAGKEVLSAIFGDLGSPDTYKAGKDSIVVCDGQTFFNSQNKISVGDLNITLNSTTLKNGAAADPSNPANYDAVNVTATAKTDDVVKGIQAFVDAYNKVYQILRDQYTTPRPINPNTQAYYKPLTPDQQSGMSTDSINAYNDKAMTGMLFGEPALNQIMNDLNKYITQGVTLSDGSRMSLFDIGISTVSLTGGDLSKAGQLAITDPDKLAKALQNNPDGVMQLFTASSGLSSSADSNYIGRLESGGIAERLNDIMNRALSPNVDKGLITQQAGIKGSSSTQDSVLGKMLSDISGKIASMNTYLTNKENFYYQQFSAMEQAITQSNSQMTYLMNYFKTGSN